MIISNYRLALVGLALLGRRCLAQVTQSFRWGFTDSSQQTSLTECANIKIIVSANNNSIGFPPYYMMAYEPGGFSTTSFVGTNATNLTWRVNHAAGTRLILGMADGDGNAGGINPDMFTVVACGESSSCLPTTAPIGLTITPNVTKDLQTCERWGLTVTGGVPPYNLTLITVAALNSTVVTNRTLPVGLNVFTYINRASTNGQIFAAASDSTGIFRNTTMLVNTVGSANVNCVGPISQTGNSTQTGANNAGVQSASKSKRKKIIIVVCVVIGGLAAITLTISLSLCLHWKRKPSVLKHDMIDSPGSFPSHVPHMQQIRIATLPGVEPFTSSSGSPPSASDLRDPSPRQYAHGSSSASDLIHDGHNNSTPVNSNLGALNTPSLPHPFDTDGRDANLLCAPSTQSTEDESCLLTGSPPVVPPGQLIMTESEPKMEVVPRESSWELSPSMPVVPPQQSRNVESTDRRRLRNLANVQNLLQLPAAPGYSRVPGTITDTGKIHDVPDIHNVQGGVIYTFPKTAEYFLFFNITDTSRFKADLRLFKPTTSYDVTQILTAIDKAQKLAAETGKPAVPVDAVLYQIAFSRRGLTALGIEGSTQEPCFEHGPAYSNISGLGYRSKRVEFEHDSIHGVFMIATQSTDKINRAVENVRTMFQLSIAILHSKRYVMPNRAENSGYSDGVSQPALRHLVDPRPGQLEVDAGVIVMGYPGDPVLDDQDLPIESRRPSWTKDGSMMILRKIRQDTKGVNDHPKPRTKEWHNIPQDGNLADDVGAKFYGARLIETPKSGTPIQLEHYHDDQELAKDNEQNNPSESACTALSEIPYREMAIPSVDDHSRGLPSVYYQSSIDHGFVKSTKPTDDDCIPATSVQGAYHGQRIIISSPRNPDSEPEDKAKYDVTSRDVEYFFVPGVSALKSWATDGHPPALDLLFLQDSTASQQPYIDAAKNGIQGVVDTLSTSGYWSEDDLRFGLIAFRDYPPQDYSFITKIYPFTSNLATMLTNLSKLVASGGGDGPEAQTAALNNALNMKWRKDAAKIVVLITDAPPHGIGESNDLIPDGDPDNKDPLVLARTMLNQGIVLHIIGCEPTLSRSYNHALDFYRNLAATTQGEMAGLVDVSSLTTVISHYALELLNVEKLLNQNLEQIIKEIYIYNKSIDDVTQGLYAKMVKDKTKMLTLSMDNIYLPCPEGDANVKKWHNAATLTEGHKGIRLVTRERIKHEFRNGGKQRVEMKEQPISLQQVHQIVVKAVSRYTEVGPGGKLTK